MFALSLILLSALLFGIHFLIFQDYHHILIYTIHDIAFLPIEVLLVTIVIHSLLERQNLQHKLEKLNMVIGTFYSGVGTQLLRLFVRYDPHITDIREDLLISTSWSSVTFKNQKKKARGFSYMVNVNNMNLEELRDLLLDHEDFLLRILENPVMLEHESFTDVLRAVFHLNEELKNRDDLTSLPEADLMHLRGDIKRAYSLMTLSWLDYMNYLKGDYPYLYSLAVRLNPFSLNGDVYIRE